MQVFVKEELSKAATAECSRHKSEKGTERRKRTTEELESQIDLGS